MWFVWKGLGDWLGRLFIVPSERVYGCGYVHTNANSSFYFVIDVLEGEVFDT